LRIKLQVLCLIQVGVRYIFIMPELNSKVQGKGIWSRITLDELIGAIASLNDRVNGLKNESWRLNNKNKQATSLWAEVIQKLKLENTESIRHSLYKIWHLKRHNIDKLVENQLKSIGQHENDLNDGNIDKISDFSDKKCTTTDLYPNLSLSLPVKPKTRSSESDNNDNNNTQNEPTEEISFVLSAAEWKAAFSRTNRKMNSGWTKIFYEKLKICGITCVIAFKKSHVKVGNRKRNCKYFWCRAKCTMTRLSWKVNSVINRARRELSGTVIGTIGTIKLVNGEIL